MAEMKQTKPTPERVASYGKRTDGTPKGAGFFGEIPRMDDPKSFSTELSAEVNIDGKPMMFPLLVPTLTRQVINHLLSTDKVNNNDPRSKQMESAIYEKAIQHAVGRINTGKSPFAQDGEFNQLPMSEDDAMRQGAQQEAVQMGLPTPKPMGKK